MKKISLLLILLFAFSLTSCSSDDDSTSGDIVGEWYVESLNSKSEMNIPGVGSIKTLGEAIDLGGNDILIFNEDHTCNSSTEGFTLEITSTSTFGGQSNEETYHEEIDALIGAGTWEKSGSNLTVTSDENGGQIKYKIKKLTDSTLTMTFTPTDDYGSDEVDFAITYTITLKRL